MVSVLFFGGGAGGGKSWLGCEWLMSNTYFYPGSKWFIARKELKRLMGSTYITFRKVCRFHNVPEGDFHLNSQYNYILNTKNGSRIDLIDASFMPSDDPLFERFGSMEFTGGWSEEAPELKFAAFEALNSRCGRHLNKEFGLLPAKHLLTGNPTKAWPYPMFYRPWKGGELPREYAFIQSLYKDNLFTSDEYGKQLSLIRDKAQRERLMNGNWEFDDDPAALMEYDAILDMFKLPREEYGEKYIVVDAARLGNDRIIIALWVGLSVKKILIRRKQTLDKTEEDIMALADSEGVQRSHIIIDEDGVGGGLVDHIKGCVGFVANRVPVADPFDLDMDGKEKRPNFRNLKAQCAYALADYVNGRRISAAGRSPKLQQEIVEELEQIRAKAVDSDARLDLVPKDEVKESIGRSPDIGDTFIMRMFFELKKPQPIYVPTQSTPGWVGRRWKRTT